MTPKQANRIFDLLTTEYPEVKSALNFSSPLECWIAVLLSVQCTDERVNKYTPKLFAKYLTIHDYATAEFDELIEFIRPLGYYRSKGKYIIDGAKKLIDLGYSKTLLPNNMTELLKLPGVGRKVASVILSQIFDIAEGVAIDTHNMRISRRIGLSDKKSQAAIEADYMSLFAKKKWKNISLLIVEHGRKVCKPKPLCEKCVLKNDCKFYNLTADV